MLVSLVTLHPPLTASIWYEDYLIEAMVGHGTTRDCEAEVPGSLEAGGKDSLSSCETILGEPRSNKLKVKCYWHRQGERDAKMASELVYLSVVCRRH
jgi:hypothetical protein